MTFNVEIQGIDRVIAKLTEMGKRPSAIMGKAMEESLLLLQRELKYYPPRPEGAKMTFKSLRQRRYFFWALKQGLITVPYRRTDVLKNGWTTKRQTTSNGITGIVGNNVNYAPWVQSAKKLPDGRGPQAKIHVGVWQTVEKVLDDNKRKIDGIFAREIELALQK